MLQVSADMFEHVRHQGTADIAAKFLGEISCVNAAGSLPCSTRMMIDPEARATPPSDQGRVLLHLRTGRMCAINGMGSRIWSELDTGRSFQEIVDALAAEYDAPRERIEADVRAFLSVLASKEYVHGPGVAR